jgi:hypothetical protein
MFAPDPFQHYQLFITQTLLSNELLLSEGNWCDIN